MPPNGIASQYNQGQGETDPNGKGVYVLSRGETVRPNIYGVTEGLSSVALQAYYNAMTGPLSKHYRWDHTCETKVDAPIVINAVESGVQVYGIASITVDGAVYLQQDDGESVLVTLRDLIEWDFLGGFILSGELGLQAADRKRVDHGLQIENAARVRMRKCLVTGCQGYAVRTRAGSGQPSPFDGDNCNGIVIEDLQVNRCGYRPNGTIIRTMLHIESSGTNTSSNDWRSTVSLNLDFFGDWTAENGLIQVTSQGPHHLEFHRVMSYDRAQKRAELFPGFPSDPGDLQVQPVMGGASFNAGGDAGQLTVRRATIANSGIAHDVRSLFGVTIERSTVEFCGIAVMVSPVDGGPSGQANLQGVWRDSYVEFNSADVVLVGSTTSLQYSNVTNFVTTGTNKVRGLVPPAESQMGAAAVDGSGWIGNSLTGERWDSSLNHKLVNAGANLSNSTIDVLDGRVIPGRTDRFIQLDASEARGALRQYARVAVLADYQGGVTIQALQQGETVNGQTSIAITGPIANGTLLIAVYDPTTGDWRVATLSP